MAALPGLGGDTLPDEDLRAQPGAVAGVAVRLGGL